MQLIKTFSRAEFDQALDSWDWIGLASCEPIFASLFGDIFFRAADGYWFLDSIDGSLSKPWATEADLRRALDSEEGQDRYLLGALATSAKARGIVLGAKQVYDFVPPPALGGSFDVDHLVVLDFVVSVNLAGQLHQQIKHLPPGTKISGFTFSGDS